MQHASKQGRSRHPRIRVRHRNGCADFDGGNCNCKPAFEAWVFDKRTERKIRKTFPTLAAAKSWRQDALPAMRKRTMAAPSRLTLREAAEQWCTAIERGEVLSRKRTPYKPSTARGYRRDFDKYVLDELGALRLSEVRRAELQLLVDDLVSRKLSGSKVRNVVTPVQAMYRWAKQRQLVGR
jgi:hypothetical protein